MKHKKSKSKMMKHEDESMAGHMYNMSKKHHMAESMGMKKAMKKKHHSRSK